MTPLSWGDWDPNAWEQTWIYRRHLPRSQLGHGRVFVDFDGVMTSATVFLNGTQIASHRGGYLPWSVELTGGLTAGDNVLAVVVDADWLDVPPDGATVGANSIDYLEPGGIYRDVGLRIVPRVFIADVFAKPVDVLGPQPSVELELTIDASVTPTEPVKLSAALLDGATQLAATDGVLALEAPGVTVATATIGGRVNVTLWSPDTPKLYQVATTIVADGVAHTVMVRIGFRDARFAPDGFYLNGQRLQIFGLNRHQLFPYTGMAAPARLQRRDAELLRTELNCNMVRCSHYPQSPHFLDACDELGLMVWEEPPGWQYIGDGSYQGQLVQDVEDMIVRDRNRPSVIVWATRPNESGNYPSLYAQTRALATALDDSRQTSGALDVHSTDGWAQDVFAYDDYDAAGGRATLQSPIPGIPYLVTEAVGTLDGAPMYRWVDTSATLGMQALAHAQVHNIARSNPAYAGLLGWAGIDYASQMGYGRLWHSLKWPGVLDTFRVPKPGAAFYRSQIDPTVRPVILPAFLWDFGPRSPANGPGPGAILATNCDRLEVYIGGAHVATGTPDRQDLGALAHPPVLVDLTVANPQSLPELRVDGYVGAQLVTTLRMSGDPAGDRLALTIDDPAIAGDGSDATRFTVRAVDAYGNQRPYVSGDVHLSLSGPANLVADNPFEFAAYGGVGGGFIRSQAGGGGTVTLVASHPTLGQATGQVAVAPAAAMAARTAPRGSSLPRSVNAAPQPPTPESVALTLLEAAIRKSLVSMLSRAELEQLVRHPGHALTFTSPASGQLVIRVHATRRRNRRIVLIATVSNTIRRAGRHSVHVRPGAGKLALLRHATHVSVTATFTPTGLARTTVTRSVKVAALGRA